MRLCMISWDVRAFMYDILGLSGVYVYLGTFVRLCMISWDVRAFMYILGRSCVYV